MDIEMKIFWLQTIFHVIAFFYTCTYLVVCLDIKGEETNWGKDWNRPQVPKTDLESKSLQDDKSLGDYSPIGHGSNIFLVSRLLGGASADSTRYIDPQVPRSKGPCSILLMDFPTPECVVLPCNRSVLPDMLAEHSRTEVFEQNKWEVGCVDRDCESKLSLATVSRYGGIIGSELHEYEERIAKNYIWKSPDTDIQECPRCKTLAERFSCSKSDVKCWACSFRFCWFCSKQWNNGYSQTSCGNPGCKGDQTTRILQEAPVKTISGFICPSTRSCPKCHTLIEHVKDCKNMTCKCNYRFCFVCLRKSPCGSDCNVADRQTHWDQTYLCAAIAVTFMCTT